MRQSTICGWRSLMVVTPLKRRQKNRELFSGWLKNSTESVRNSSNWAVMKLLKDLIT